MRCEWRTYKVSLLLDRRFGLPPEEGVVWPQNSLPRMEVRFYGVLVGPGLKWKFASVGVCESSQDSHGLSDQGEMLKCCVRPRASCLGVGHEWR